jgi:predicted metal-dependent TIM-barrel fold hydrolase
VGWRKEAFVSPAWIKSGAAKPVSPVLDELEELLLDEKGSPVGEIGLSELEVATPGRTTQK